MKQINKYKKNFIVVIVIAIISLSVTSTINAEECYYTNDLGISLNYKEYTYLMQFVDFNDLELFTQEEADYLIENIAVDGVETDTKYIKTEFSLYDGTVLCEEYISEEEMIDELNGRNIKISGNDRYTSSTYGYDPAKRYDSITSDMKKIELNMYSVAPSAKKVIIKCTWLSIPKCKSYGVMGFRVPGYYSGLIIDTSATDNIFGYQNYDGQVIKYDSSSKNIKKSNRGIGVSMNIIDSVSKSLSMSFSVTFGTKQDPFAVIGTYQHAQKDLTLSKSQRYTIETLGMGGVFKFNSSVESYYDDAPGLTVIGSIEVD